MVHNKTPVFVLQHPKERSHPLNTVHIASQCLSNIEVRHTPIDTDDCAAWTEKAALLFPHHNSLPLPINHTGPLLILDATWPKAQGMRLSIPSLLRKTCYHLPGFAKGEYKIRKSPTPYALSSIEAIANALEYLEQNPNGYEALRIAFRARINMQIKHIDNDIFHQNYPQKQ